ncbi:hypothetical protein MKX01_032764, partial [Papaver californicum]
MSCLLFCCASLSCGLCTSVSSGISGRSARLGYCGLFGLSLITSWILSEEWLQINAVFRVSLGNFLFFDQNDKRLVIHHGGWTVKFVVWVLLIVLMFFVPDVIISLYETLSKFGSGLFLLVQVVILLDATHTWNDAWVEKDERNWYIALLAVSVGCYIAGFTIAGLMFIWFNPSGHDCGLNVFFIVMTMILALGFAIIALHPQHWKAEI